MHVPEYCDRVVSFLVNLYHAGWKAHLQRKEVGQELNQIVEACICIGLDNVTGYGVVSDYAITYANVYAIGYVNNRVHSNLDYCIWQ
jgi:hypothetical protein